MTEVRAPSPVACIWTAHGPGVPPGAILVEARLAIEARDAARLYLRRHGWEHEQCERIQVREWKLNGHRSGVLINAKCEVMP